MVLTLSIFAVYLFEFVVGNGTVEVSNSTQLLKCPPFDSVEHAEVSVINVGYNDTANRDVLHVRCLPGYDLVGPPKIRCLDGRWETSQRPKCTARCGGPPPIANGTIDVDGVRADDGTYKKGAVASYACDADHVLTPPDSRYRVCIKGIWTGANVTCAPVERSGRCGPAERIRNGDVVHEKREDEEEEGFAVGQTVEYTCDGGYFLKGESVRTCTADGAWTPKLPPTCVSNDERPTHCSPHPIFPNSYNKFVNGFESFEFAVLGTEVEISCLPRYRNANSPCEPARLRCIAGQWMGIPPNCVAVNECKCPPKVALATPFLYPQPTFDVEKTCHIPVNTTISYLCLPGYELEGYKVLTCGLGGCWDPIEPPVCKMKESYYYVSANGGEPIVFSLATGAGVLLLLVIACLIIVCRKRKSLSRSVALPPPVPRADLADHATLLHPPDRLALIAFADGMQVGQSGLPTYEEATRDRSLGIASRLQRPPWPTQIGRRSRNSPNPDILFTRQGSFASHSASTRSGGDPMGSTDTMAVSENSTTVTLDTASSHSGSQPASCRAHCGSLASFDTSSVLNTEGVPLLEESELEEIQCGETVSLAMENRSMCDNTSYKFSTASDVA